MTTDAAVSAIKKEMNRRRRSAGALDVSDAEWMDSGIDNAVRLAVGILVKGGFAGDWDEASLEAEDAMGQIAEALRAASVTTKNRSDLYRFQTLRQASEVEDGFTHTQPGADDIHTHPRTVFREDAGSRALADYLTWIFRQDGFATYTHKRVCGDEFLTRQQAWEFLTSSLPKVFSYDEYQQIGLCPAKTKGRILSKYLQLDAVFFYTEMLMVDPDTGVSMATTDTLKSKVGNYCVEIRIDDGTQKGTLLTREVVRRNEGNYKYVSEQQHLTQAWFVADYAKADYYVAPMAAPFFPDERRYVEGYGESIMGELIESAEFLCWYYPVSIWDMLEALLTGQFPPLSALELFEMPIQCKIIESPDEVSVGHNFGFVADGPVTLTVQPWVTPEVLADAWKEFRKKNPSYSPSEKQADTMRFVLSHTLPGEDFRWESLAQQWKEERGELITRTQLYKQFQRARVAILPGYTESKSVR